MRKDGKSNDPDQDSNQETDDMDKETETEGNEINNGKEPPMKRFKHLDRVSYW